MKFHQQYISFSRFTKRCHVNTQRNNGYCCGSCNHSGEKLWDVKFVIFLSAFIFTELFQSLFNAIQEFKEFFIRKSIHKDIVLLFIITVIINARKNSYSHRIIRGSYFMHCIPYVELNILNIDVSFCISETWWHRHLSRRHTYIVSSTRSFIRKVTRGTLNTRTTRSVFVDKVHEFSIITLNVMPTKKLYILLKPAYETFLGFYP